MSFVMSTIPVRRRCVLAGDGVQAIDFTVWCPNRNQSLALDVCATCKHLDSFVRHTDSGRHSFVECSPPTTGAAPHEDAHIDVQEAATRARIADVMRRDIVCVRADASLDSIANVLLTEGSRCIPVVDADSRPIGVISKSDLLRDCVDSRNENMSVAMADGFHVDAGDAHVASDVMTPFVHALPENAPLAFAVALMASEAHLEVPVVDDDGKVVGIVTALETMRWLARRFGYVFGESA